jgi:hypothetical protein
LANEARRRGVSAAEVLRLALAEYVRIEQPREIAFAGIGRSGRHNIAGRFEELLAQEGFPSRHRE